jgi:hypothetical protein
MKISIIKYSILLLILTSSCSISDDEVDRTIDLVEYQAELKSTERNFGKEVLLNEPSEIININDKFMIVSDSDQEGYIKVFDLPGMNYLYSWGSQGRGPNEFFFLPLDDINAFKNQIYLYEMATRALREYEVTDTSLVYVNEMSLQYKDQVQPLVGITRFDNDMYIAEYSVPDKPTTSELVALRPGNEEELFTFGNFPETELTGFDRLFEYHKTLAASEQIGRIAAFYTFQNRIKFFNDNGVLLKNLKIEDNTIDSEGIEGQRFRFRNIEHTNADYIYALGWNAFIDEINENLSDFKTSFEVWDWEGELLYRSYFDRLVSNFTVSEEYGKIYGITPLDIHTIYEYEIPKNELLNSEEE